MGFKELMIVDWTYLARDEMHSEDLMNKIKFNKVGLIRLRIISLLGYALSNGFFFC
jgi:hypothetical protein